MTTGGGQTFRRLSSSLADEYMSTIPARLRAAAVLILLSAGLLACGGGSVDKEVETLQSWRRTIDFAGEARLRGWVTPRYVRQLRDEAHAELGTAAKLAASGKASLAGRDSLTVAAAELQHSIAHLDRAGP
jgi:hypothetical protein